MPDVSIDLKSQGCFEAPHVSLRISAVGVVCSARLDLHTRPNESLVLLHITDIPIYLPTYIFTYLYTYIRIYIIHVKYLHITYTCSIYLSVYLPPSRPDIYIYIYIWYVCMCMYIYIYICIYIHMYIYIHIYIYTHTYMHILHIPLRSENKQCSRVYLNNVPRRPTPPPTPGSPRTQCPIH